MNELDAVVTAWAEAEQRGESAILATVVDVKGSAYRRPGARMLMTEKGHRVGSISGVCLEGDVIKKAWWWTESGEPIVRTFDTTSGDEAVWEFGLGCNGVVRVLLERVGGASSAKLKSFLGACREERATGVVATVIAAPSQSSLRPGDRMFAFPSVEVFIEVIAPPLPLLVFGAGHDAIPVVQMAKHLGWHVTVFDTRPAYTNHGRLAAADRVVLTRPDDIFGSVPVDPQAAAVVMNHNYPKDRAVLRDLLSLPVRYIGVLGPRARTEKMLADIGVKVWPPHLYAPVGLDIGAETPEAIALAIVAEIQAVLAGRSGGTLRERSGSTYPHAEQRARETFV